MGMLEYFIIKTIRSFTLELLYMQQKLSQALVCQHENTYHKALIFYTKSPKQAPTIHHNYSAKEEDLSLFFVIILL